MIIDLTELQKKLYEWQEKNFPLSDIQNEAEIRHSSCIAEEIQANRLVLGINEEAGEIAHAVLKFYQGIRNYNHEKMEEDIKDGIADIIIYCCNLASLLEIDISEALDGVSQKVLKRDWKSDPQAGGE